ncbi:hypothetical protein J6590_039181 [Homalodisca vitripennis]|nr:hypothetical protein J6590_039181 [Homalodisca vitripennis]
MTSGEPFHSFKVPDRAAPCWSPIPGRITATIPPNRTSECWAIIAAAHTSLIRIFIWKVRSGLSPGIYNAGGRPGHFLHLHGAVKESPHPRRHPLPGLLPAGCE